MVAISEMSRDIEFRSKTVGDDSNFDPNSILMSGSEGRAGLLPFSRSSSSQVRAASEATYAHGHALLEHASFQPFFVARRVFYQNASERAFPRPCVFLLAPFLAPCSFLLS